MADVALIDYTHRAPPIRLRSSSETVRRQFRKSLATQATEMWQLRRSCGRLAPNEYYYFGLYDDDRFSWEEKARFIGVAVQNQILWKCTDVKWWSIALDKVAFFSFMSHYGFPVLDVQAALHPVRGLPAIPALRGREDAARFLRHEARYPLFTKPFDGMRSVGSARIESYLAETDEVVTYSNGPIPLDKYLDVIAPYLESGYLIQSVQQPHHDVRAICGDRLACVRFVVLWGPKGPEPFRAVWKIPAGRNLADNFWRDGNLLAGLDLETGRVTRVIRGAGVEKAYVARHPDTGASLVGIQVPDWQKLKSLCLQAASTLPGITLQGWDVAPSERGPVLVEVNVGGDFTLPQLGTETGMLDDRLRDFLRDHSFPLTRLPPWGFQLWPALEWRVRAALAKLQA